MPATKPPGQQSAHRSAAELRAEASDKAHWARFAQSARRKPAPLQSSEILEKTADPPRRPRNSLPSWCSKGPGRKEPIYLVYILPFSSRGMTRIYYSHHGYPVPKAELLRFTETCRETHGFIHINCNLDMWQSKDGRIFIRFHANRRRLESPCFELLGHPAPPDPKNCMGVDEDWIPEVVRDAYDEWIRDCLDNPDNI